MRWPLALLVFLPAAALAQGTDDSFGNPWMSNLVEVEPPPPVPWWPPAPGWFVLAGLMALVLLSLLRQAWRRWNSNAYKREALTRLAAIEELVFAPDSRRSVLAKLPVLLKQTALAAFAREEVASLSGEQWTSFLDASADMRDFSDGPAKVVSQLAHAPRAAKDLDEKETKQVLEAARRWIRKHDARYCG